MKETHFSSLLQQHSEKKEVSNSKIQVKLGITRSLGPGNFVCYNRYVVLLAAKNHTRQKKCLQ